MMSSSCSGLDVYDFKEEDELPELLAGKILRKFRNPSFDESRIIKYEFLERVAQETTLKRKERDNVSCVNIDVIDCHQSSDEAISCNTLHKNGEYFSIRGRSLSTFFEPETRVSSLEPSSPGKCELNCALVDTPSREEPVDIMSDADKSVDDITLSSPTSDDSENHVFLNGHGSCADDFEMDEENIAVVVHPDYVVYRENYCTGSQLAFSQSCIKLKNSNACENRGSLTFEWGIDDIVDIYCQWFQSIETVMVKLHLKSRDAAHCDNVHETSGTEELKFAAVDPNWSEKQDDIISLNEKYLDLWNVLIDADMHMDGDNLLRQRHYFPSFDEFEDVIYPKGDADAVSISKRDVDLLQPDTFVNDTIIDFYIKYLKNQIQPEERCRFHFFNSFFFRKLADLDKDPSSASDGRAAFLRVRKWTRKVDLFQKDYIFIPVNFNLHWSLLVICHPGELARFQDLEFENSNKVPCILHMDSIKGSHAGLKNLVQSYLWEEWKERKMGTTEDVSMKFLNLRFVDLELPQQENSFDCGLFLLHYLELFLAEAPESFSPFKITKFSNFLTVDWFPPVEASLKRALIQKLIFELLENHSQEVSPAAFIDEIHLSYPEDNKKNETGVELLSERCNPAIACHGNVISSQDGQGIEMTILEASSVRHSQFVNDSSLVLRELFEHPGSSAVSLLGRYQAVDQISSSYNLKGAVPSIEEDPETGEQFVFLQSGQTAFQQTASQACPFSFSPQSFGAETTWSPGISGQPEQEDIDSSPETSICASDYSEDVVIIESCPVGDKVAISHKEQVDLGRSPSVGNIECLTDDVTSASNEMLDI